VDDPFGDLSVNPIFSGIGPGATIVLTDVATGTFTYNPPAGSSGVDTFQFQVCDDGAPTPPAQCSAPATVSVSVTGPDLWFVQQGASGTGRLTDPFGTLASLPAARGNGDRIFAFSGTYGTGLTVFTNEHLIGQGSSGAFDSVLGVTVPGNGTLDTSPGLGGTRPELNGVAPASTVTLGSGSTVRGLNINSTTATGLSGGMVAGVSVSEASVTSTTGTAVNLSSTGGTVSLTAVSANGGTNGIVLNITTGSFTVTGDAGSANNGSGGTIQNTTAHGISLASTQNVSLDQMSIQTTGGSGINGTLVNTFSFTNGTVNNAGNGGQESAIAFNGNGSLLGNNIAGTLTVTGSSFTNPFYSGLDVQSDNGTVSNANVSNNTVTNPGFSGINFVGTNNASTVFNLTRATVNQNNVSGSGANGIQFSISGVNAGGPGATAGTPGSATDIISITNNSVSLDGGGTQAITVANGGGNSASRTRTNFLIECNGKNAGGCTAPTANPLTGSLIGTVVLIGNNGFSTMTGTVNNNVIDANHTPNLGGGNGIGGGNGVSGAGNAWTPDLTLSVTNNTMTDVDGNGILLVGRVTSGIAKLKITGNNVAAPINAGGSARQGIRVDAGNSLSADDAVCLNISGNTSAGSNGGAGIGIRKEGIVATTNDFGITGLVPSPANAAQATAFVAGNNPAGGGVDSISGASDNFTSCTTAPL